MQYYVIPFKRAGGLHKNYSEIDFLIVSDRGDWYISHRKILLLAEREVIACRKSALQCNCIASAIFNRMPWKSTLNIILKLSGYVQWTETQLSSGQFFDLGPRSKKYWIF